MPARRFNLRDKPTRIAILRTMVYAKKTLGQNFLKSTSALDKIVAASKITTDSTVLEIGPGRGALTQALLATGAHVVAVEKDTELLPVLQEKFAGELAEGQLALQIGDILETEITDLGLPADYTLAANIPYYITGAIIRRFLETDLQPKRMVLLVQKEVAERIVGPKDAKKEKENILSLSVKAYGEPRYVATVSASSFDPKPKVDSAILAVEHISKDNFIAHKISEQDFFKTVKAGFAQKRKTLLNNFKQAGFEPDHIKAVFEKLQIQEKIRAEDLKLTDWFNLTQELGS